MRFSRKKFQALTTESKLKKIYDFIREIENSWQDEVKRSELLDNFRMCTELVDNGVYNSVDSDVFGKISTKMNRREFMEVAALLERYHKSDLRDSDIPGITIEKGDGRRLEQRKLPLYLILDNLRSSFNVGSIFRSAECFGISEICLCGYTPLPNSSKVQTTSMGTAELVEWKHFEKTEEAIDYLREKGCKIYAVETAEKANLLAEINFEDKSAFIMGNEALGISEDILALADEVVKIELMGWKNSLNVGVTTAIVCYEVGKKLK